VKRGVPKRELPRENERLLSWEDGKEPEAFRTQARDLELTHGRSSGRITTLLEPMTREETLKDSRVLAEEWVNGWNGTIQAGSMVLFVTRARRVATRILESAPTSVGGVTAHGVTFETVDADQLEVDPKAPRIRGRLLVVDAKLRKPLYKLFGRKRLVVPARLVILYVNSAGSFEAELPVFDDLVRRIDLTAAKL
jgi:hypothetical protein